MIRENNGISVVHLYMFLVNHMSGLTQEELEDAGVWVSNGNSHSNVVREVCRLDKYDIILSAEVE